MHTTFIPGDLHNTERGHKDSTTFAKDSGKDTLWDYDLEANFSLSFFQSFPNKLTIIIY